MDPLTRWYLRIPLFVLLTVVADAAASECAAAGADQDPAAMFGQTSETTRPTSVVNASVFGGSGESLIGDDGVNASAVTKTQFLGVHTTTTFSRRNPNRQFSVSAGTAVRYFPETREFLTIDRSARIGYSTRLGARNIFSASQSVLYSPFHQFGQPIGGMAETSSGESPLSNPDAASAVGRASYDMGTAVGLERTFRKASLSLGFTSRMNLYSTSADNVIAHRAGIGFKLPLGRYTSLILGTASRFGRTGSASAPTRTQDIDFGIDYNRPLSFSRQTTVTFTTGTALISRRGTSADTLEVGRRFRVLGAVSALRSFGRDWQTRIGYDRNVQFVDGFPDPFFTDGVSARINGRFGRRLTLRMQADYAVGKAVENEAVELGKSFRGTQTQVRFTYGLSRYWQLYAEHHYTENHLSVAALQSLPAGLVPRRYGRGLRFGLNLWAPHVY